MTIIKKKPSELSAGTVTALQTKLNILTKTEAESTYVKTEDIETPTSMNLETLAVSATLTAPTKAVGTNTTDVATTAFVVQNTWVKVDGGVTTRITHTGTTNETTLHTMTFPSARLGLNGRILMTGIFDSTTGDGFTKNIYVKVNGTTVATFSAVTSTLIYPYIEIICRNSVSNKIILSGQLNLTTNADAPTAAVDTSTGTVTITITCALSNSGAATYIDAFSVCTMY